MRDGCFEVVLLSSTRKDQLYEEEIIETPDSTTTTTTTCVKAIPNEEYSVKVNVYRNKDGKFPAPLLRIGLFVDGVDVQYWKRIDLTDNSILTAHKTAPVSTRFWGFKQVLIRILNIRFLLPTHSLTQLYILILIIPA